MTHHLEYISIVNLICNVINTFPLAYFLFLPTRYRARTAFVALILLDHSCASLGLN